MSGLPQSSTQTSYNSVRKDDSLDISDDAPDSIQATTTSQPYSFSYHFDQDKIEKLTRIKEKKTQIQEIADHQNQPVQESANAEPQVITVESTNVPASVTQLQQQIHQTQQHYFTVCSNGFIPDFLPKNSVVYFEITIQHTVNDGDVVVGLSPLFNAAKGNSFFTGKMKPDIKEKPEDLPIKLDFDYSYFAQEKLIAKDRKKESLSNTQIDVHADYGTFFYKNSLNFRFGCWG